MFESSATAAIVTHKAGVVATWRTACPSPALPLPERVRRRSGSTVTVPSASSSGTNESTLSRNANATASNAIVVAAIAHPPARPNLLIRPGSVIA